VDGDPDLGILLTLAMRGFVDCLHAELGVRGFADLRPPYGVVFRALRDKPLTLTELAGRLGVTKQSAAKVVNEMAAKNLLQRKDSTTDGRAKSLELTPRGREAMATAIAVGGELRQRLQNDIGPNKLRAMCGGLTALVEMSGLGEDLARRSSPALWDQP
jgi:DNA-binding MarR family transcriptional regulator